MFTVPYLHRTPAPSEWQSPSSILSGRVSDSTAPYGRDWAAVDASLRPRLQGMAMRVLGHVEDAEDAVQEALLQAWTNADSVRDPGAFEAWMFAVQRNIALRAAQRRKVRRMARMGGWDPVDRRQPRPDAVPILEELVEALPAGEQRVVKDLAAGHDLSAIAVREDASYCAVKTRLCRARAKVRAALTT